MSFDPRDLPDTAELLEAFGQALKLGLRTHVPARIVTYDSATQTAVVQVELRTVVRVKSIDEVPPGSDVVGAFPDAKAVLPPKVLQNIPVHIYGTAAAYVSLPIVPGTTGTLHVHDRDIHAWLLKGTPCDPIHTWTHILESSEFHPGTRPKSGAIVPPTHATALVVEAPEVLLGRTATLPVARQTDTITGSAALLTWAQAVEVALNTLAPGSVATLWAAGAGAANGLGSITSGATKAKAE